ncbi:interleukin-12 subunit beta [Rhinophrynus dorsalis]
MTNKESNDMTTSYQLGHNDPKAIVVDLNDSVNLRSIHLECPVDKDTKVTWHNSGSQLNGRTLIKYVMENRDGGNYTCLLEDGTVVDYKVVLVHDHGAKLYQKIVSESRKPITCEAKNYTGQFSCSWKAAKSHDEFIFEAHRGSYPITCDQPTRHGSTYAVNCHDTQSCNYAEEDQNIVVVLHAIASKNYENHTHSFLLRDITKPDPPNDLGKLINNTGVFIKWKYPKTWCNVHSFFPLIFNVNVTDINKGHSEHHPHVESTEVSTTLTGKFSFCVQARDMYYKSSWSDWSCYM